MVDSPFPPDLIRSSADLVRLALLKARPIYGHEILVTPGSMETVSSIFKQGTLYPLLYRIERKGWIRAKWNTPPKGKRRTVYSLTPDGREAYRARILEFADAARIELGGVLT
jgi:PadR family transcriptional regulator PadR